MYRTFSPTPLTALERNRPGEEGKLEEDGGMGKTGRQFFCLKENEFSFRSKEEINTHADLVFQSLIWKRLGTSRCFPD